MKKNLIIILIISLLALTITGCTKNNIGSKSKYNINNSQISLEVKQQTLTTSSATLIIINHTDEECTYGNPYSIEKKVNDTWYELNTINDLYFTMPAIILKANESNELTIDWEYGYGSLKPGTYRLVKEVSNYKETFYIAAEFTIE